MTDGQITARHADPEATVIIHNHVFKNAGSTIDWALRRNFGDGFVDHRDDRSMQRGPDYLGPYLEQNPGIRALSTHHLRPPLPQLPGRLLMCLMMFRNPIERVTSVYRFERGQIDEDSLGARYAREHSLGEYVSWRMRFDVPPTIRNFHIYRSLPGPLNWRRALTGDELSVAKEFVASVPLLGFVDRFDESMILFEYALRPLIPGIDMSYRMQNVGQKAGSTGEDRLALLRKEIGEELFAQLAERNRYDLDLYDYARELFDKRLLQVVDMEADLSEFRARSAALGG